MTRVTSKRQVTIPKLIADQYDIAPGDDIEFVPAGDSIRVHPPIRPAAADRSRRLELFDRATERQQGRQRGVKQPARSQRGWRREDLYERGSAG